MADDKTIKELKELRDMAQAIVKKATNLLGKASVVSTPDSPKGIVDKRNAKIKMS